MSRQILAELRPAFKSTTHAGCFLTLVLLALLLPVVVDKSGRLSRRDSYDIVPENQGPYSFVSHEVFDNKDNIDLLFLGNSYIFAAIDTPQVQSELARTLKRPVRVVTFGSDFAGMDVPYAQLRDLLERKRAGLVVSSIPRVIFNDSLTPASPRFLRYGEYRDLVDGLPVRYRLSLYAANVLRSPHDLLTFIRRNRVPPSPFTANLGAAEYELGWYGDQSTFENFTPSAPSIPASAVIYSNTTRGKFVFTGDRLPVYHERFLESIVALLRSKQIPLVMINVPQFKERHSPQIIEREDWAKSLNADISLLGIPPAALFAGLSESDIQKLHYNEHMNKNGSAFFTRAILPAIVQVYSDYASKN